MYVYVYICIKICPGGFPLIIIHRHAHTHTALAVAARRRCWPGPLPRYVHYIYRKLCMNYDTHTHTHTHTPPILSHDAGTGPRPSDPLLCDRYKCQGHSSDTSHGQSQPCTYIYPPFLYAFVSAVVGLYINTHRDA